MKHKLFFVSAVMTPSILDGILTLIGQPIEYWSNYHKINEASPISFLAFGPIVYLLSILIYTIIIGFIVYKLSKWPAIAVGLFFAMSHSSGVESWAPYIMVERLHISYDYYWYVSVIYLATLAILIAFSMRKWLMSEQSIKTRKNRTSLNLLRP